MLKGLAILGTFFASAKVDYFCDFRFAVLHTKPFLNRGSTLQGKNLSPLHPFGMTFSLIWLISKAGKVCKLHAEIYCQLINLGSLSTPTYSYAMEALYERVKDWPSAIFYGQLKVIYNPL